jgi:uncharacterized Zn finger protein/DNA-binding XRE family transcriptional regulator
MSRWQWKPYVPVAQRRAKAAREMDKLRTKGACIRPIVIEGRTIARSFWGKGWCEHLESFSDYENRLPRGRTYVRNGSVCHLDVQAGRIEAIVSGSELYRVKIDIEALKKAKWQHIKKTCSGQIGSLIELLQGKLSDQVMEVVTQRQEGLFPLPHEIKLGCSCPDYAVMCKHVAAVLYGVGNLLDAEPALLFTLRCVDPQELISAGVTLPEQAGHSADSLNDEAVADIFGIELEANDAPLPAATPARAGKSGKTGKAGPRKQSTPAHEPSREPKPQSRKFVPMGPRIAGLRKRAGMSIARFAEHLGVTPASVYRWENTRGKINLHARNLEALQALYDSLRE